MRGGIATDHGGFGLMKEELVAHLRVAGHEVIEFGAHGLSQRDNYPDFVVPLARSVGAGKVERGGDLRQRRRRIGLRKQDTRHSRRAGA
jgi:ribose 5-phosphate isomerase B